MDGIFNVNKPTGKTSFNIVSFVKQLTGECRVGHAGTLDPMAGGVLPVCLGKGTRVIEFLLEARKVYRAQIELGTSTNTLDASGNVTRQGDFSTITLERLKQALNSFQGLIQQTPPMFSAVKYKGKRLYHLAREGISIERQSRAATIYRLDLLGFKPPLFTLEIECSRGTYIRSLAHDLGELLGCGAHLKTLTRLSYGPFDIETAISPNQLEDAFSDNNWRSLIYPIDIVLRDWPAVFFNNEQEKVISNGGLVTIDNSQMANDGGKRCRAYNKDGFFLAVLYFNVEKEKWQPQKVFV